MRAGRSILNLMRRRRGRDGVAAVEFAFVGLPFFIGLFAIFELGLIFTVDSVLDNATTTAGRLIRTGQAESENMTKAQFEAAVCARMSIFAGDCPDRLSVDVRVVTSFANTVADPNETGEFDEEQTAYANGQPLQLMLVRVWYRHPMITPLFNQAVQRQPDGSTLLRASTAFRNEPPGYRSATPAAGGTGSGGGG